MERLDNFIKQHIWIPQAIAIALLVIAIARKNPYDYYTLLRWVCSGVFLYLAFIGFRIQKLEWVWVFGFFLVLYNPIFKVTFKREIWEWINGATIGALVLSMVKMK
ncbi:MAG: hypothetical protein N2450_06395, partial [bacterium]|nr:hypothetical protein [bacterium]